MATSDDLRQAQLRFEADERAKREAETASKIVEKNGKWIESQIDDPEIDDPEKIKAVVEKTAEISALEQTTPGRQSVRDLDRIIPDAVEQVKSELKQQQEAENAQNQALPSAEQAQEQPTQATGTPEYGAQQELLPRDRDHTQIGRYDELKALSEAQRPQENQSVGPEWHPTGIEVCGSTEIPPKVGPTEPPHSPTQQPAATNENFVDALSSHQQHEPDHQDTLQAMIEKPTAANPSQPSNDHLDTLQVMKDEHPAADHSREQHDNDLMKDFVTQETKDHVAAQERQQDLQRQRENENNMAM